MNLLSFKKLIYFIFLINFLFANNYNKIFNQLDKDKNYTELELELRNNIISLGKSSRTSFNKSDIRFEKDRIIIETNSRRTNIQSTIVKSYWLCGYTLSRTNLYFPEVLVIINVSRKGNVIIASANGLDVIALGNRKLSDYELNKEFINSIDIFTQN